MELRKACMWGRGREGREWGRDGVRGRKWGGREWEGIERKEVGRRKKVGRKVVERVRMEVGMQC